MLLVNKQKKKHQLFSCSPLIFKNFTPAKIFTPYTTKNCTPRDETPSAFSPSFITESATPLLHYHLILGQVRRECSHSVASYIIFQQQRSVDIFGGEGNFPSFLPVDSPLFLAYNIHRQLPGRRHTHFLTFNIGLVSIYIQPNNLRID